MCFHRCLGQTLLFLFEMWCRPWLLHSSHWDAGLQWRWIIRGSACRLRVYVLRKRLYSWQSPCKSSSEFTSRLFNNYSLCWGYLHLTCRTAWLRFDLSHEQCLVFPHRQCLNVTWFSTNAVIRNSEQDVLYAWSDKHCNRSSCICLHVHCTPCISSVSSFLS